MGYLYRSASPALRDPAATILDVDRAVSRALADPGFPKQQFGVPLAASLIPWIDKDLGNGQRPGGMEGWRGVEQDHGYGGPARPVEGICVRVGAMRCHSQALTIKLTRDVPMHEVEALLAGANPWYASCPTTAKRRSPNCPPRR